MTTIPNDHKFSHIEDERLRFIFEHGSALSWTKGDLDYALTKTQEAWSVDSRSSLLTDQTLVRRGQALSSAEFLTDRGYFIEAMLSLKMYWRN